MSAGHATGRPGVDGLHPRPRPSDVAVLIVTYGDRWDLCKGTIDRALESGAGSVFVVDNASTHGPRLQRWAALEPRLRCIANAENAGSARAYGQAVEAALDANEARYLWLLDDDNWPEPDALRRLLDAVDATRELDAQFAHRPDRHENRAGHVAAPPAGSFQYFDLWSRAVHRLRRRVDDDSVPYGPYGGLLLSRRAAQRIGLPDGRLFLYEDDTEYTYRLAMAGGRLRVNRSAVVHDADASWASIPEGSGPVRLLTSARTDLRHYAVRNRAYFESRVRPGSVLRYRLNKAVFMTFLAIQAARRTRLDDYRAVRQAIRLGESATFLSG